MFTGLKLRQRVEEAALVSGVKEDSVLFKLAHQCSDRLLQSKSSSTNLKYLHAFRRWEGFITSHGHKALPGEPIQVALYLTHLLNCNSSDNVILSARYGIRWAHLTSGLDDPTSNAFVTSLCDSARRTAHVPTKKKDPVTAGMLQELCKVFKDSTDVMVVRDVCMIVVAFAGFFRFDELRGLRCCDITWSEMYFSVNICKSKTDQFRQGNSVVISKGLTEACPFMWLKRYFQMTQQTTASDNFLFRPVFRSKGVCNLIGKNKQISYSSTRQSVTKRLGVVAGNLNVGLHSLRAGGATAAARSSVNERCWKRHGRWRSDVSKDGYVEDSLEARLKVTQRLGL